LDQRGDDVRKVYEICPNTTITIGVPTDTTFTSFAGGDFPLGVIRPNVTIEGNGATLVGGLYQLVTLPVFQYPSPAGGGVLTFAAPKEDVIFKDLVFTGPLFGGTDFAASSILLSGPGNVKLENILITDFSITGGASCADRPMYVGEVVIAPGLTPPGSVSVEIDGLTMTNAVISNCTSLVFSDGQVLAMKNSRISTVDGNSIVSCANEGSSCVVEDTCITDSTVYTAPFYMGGSAPDPISLVITNVYVDSITAMELNGTCIDGEVLMDAGVFGDGMYNCIDLPTADACPLDPTEAPTGTTPPTTDAPSDGGKVPTGSILASMITTTITLAIFVTTAGLS
jgi:hypothetical protein